MRALRLLMGLISGLLGLLLVVIGIVGPAAAVAVGPPGFTVTVAADAEYVVTGGSVTLAGTVKPAAPHQPVEVQQKRDGAWVTVATTSLDPHSRYSVAVTLRDLGDQQLRVTKGGRGAIAPGTSPVVKVNVSSVQLADETVVLTDEDTAHVVSFDLESGRLELDAGADMSDVRVGSILAAGFSEQTPDGMLRRVTSIAPAASGGWVLATEQASISEAVVRTVGDEQITGTLEKQEVVPAKGVTVNGSARTYGWAASVPLPEVSLSWSDSFDVSTPKPDGGAEGGPGDVGVYGQGSFSVGTEVSLKSGGEMEWDQDWFTVKRIRAAFHSELETKTSTSVTGKVGGLFRKPLAKVHRFYSFPLGPVPVVFEETSEMNFEFDFSYEGGGEISETSTDSATVGFDYRDGHGFDPVYEHDGKHEVEETHPKGAVVVDASVGPQETIKAYGLAGVTVGLAGYVKYEAGIDGSDISCPLSAGVRVNGGVVGGIDLFVKDLEWSWTKTGEFQLFSQDLCALKPHIATTFLPDAQVGDAYSTQLELLDDRGGYWTLGTESPPGLTLSSAGLLSGTPTKAGSYDLPITFTDFDGLVAHATLTLVVKPNRIVVTTDSLPEGVVKMPYAATLQADGGRGPYTWTILDGSVPGLVFHDDGSVTGEPASAGSGTLHVKVVDADGLAGEGDVTWAVSELPPPVLGPVSGPITPPPSCGAACGTSWGDPHLVTFDGLSYDAQLVGELVLTKSTVDDFQVQVRQQPWNGSQLVAVNTATAMDVNGDRVGIYLTPTGVRTTVDGETVTPGPGGMALPAGGSIRHDAAGRLETVAWPDGTSVTASYVPGSYITLRLGIPSERLGHLTGLLGDAGGDRSDDLRARGGDVVPTGSPAAVILRDFADTWRLGEGESLFDYAEGESTASLTDPVFPYVHVTVADLPTAQSDAAFRSCQASGVVGQSALDACALDVALSGDPDMAAGALVMQSGTGAGEVAGNGSFEQPAIGSRFVSLGVGATMGAWTVESGSVDLVHSSYWQPAAGNQSIDLNSCSPGRISQTMSVEPGQRYRIAYSYAGNPETADRLKKFHVEVDGTVVDRRTFDTTGRTTGSMGWTSAVTAFVATGDRATIAFQSDQLGSCGGAALDDIVITPVSTSTSVIASSNPGDAWTDQSGASGLAELSYGHTGCTSLDASLRCVGGGWAVMDDAPWVWAHQFTRNGEGPVTFTRTVRITSAQASHQLRLTAMGDDVMTAAVDGQQVLSGGFTSPTSADLTLTPGDHTLTFVVTNLGGYQPSNNPGGLAWKLRTVD